jgi:holo-[acyl-carrier protein] synthase
VVRSGVDIIEIERIRQAALRHGERFLGRVYTADELICCRGRFESLAARFAAKEAVTKALGTGVWREGITWVDVEVLRDGATGAPVLHLHGAAARLARRLGLNSWSLSLSHDRTRAVAFVVALGE